MNWTLERKVRAGIGDALVLLLLVDTVASPEEILERMREALDHRQILSAPMDRVPTLIRR